MKKKIYLRIAQGTTRVEASMDSKAKPIMTKGGQYGRDVYYPTIEIPLMIEIPDSAFPKSRKAIEIKIDEYNICDEVEIKPIKEQIEDSLEDVKEGRVKKV